MKNSESTGIVRRIDDLGRIVLPKELRKNLRINPGDNLEIKVKDDKIILSKFSLIKKIEDLAQELTDAIFTFLPYNIFITDTSQIIAGSGKLKKEYINKNISESIINSIFRREKLIESHYKEFSLIDNNTIVCSYILSTIISNGEALGMIIVVSDKEKLADNEMKIIDIVSSFISKYLEE